MPEQLSLPFNEPTYFYHYHQNNSGGHWHRSDTIGENVVVEARSAGEANDLAENIGLYFDGSGDCDCCGNRWSPMWKDDNKPDGWSVFATADEVVAKHAPRNDPERPWDKGSQVVIHYLDGRVEWHFKDVKFS